MSIYFFGTILRMINEVVQENISYTSDTDKNYNLNTVDTLNTLLFICMFASVQLKDGDMYNVYLCYLFMDTEKYNTKPTHKKFYYYPYVVVIDNLIIGNENSNGNTTICFHQNDML